MKKKFTGLLLALWLSFAPAQAQPLFNLEEVTVADLQTQMATGKLSARTIIQQSSPPFLS
jgi:hypothetical protein